MAVAVAQVGALPHYIPGAQKKVVRDVTFDASYPTGGEPLTAADLGLLTVDHTLTTVKTAGAGSVTAAKYIPSTSKLVAYAAGAEIANTTDLSAVTVQVVAYGT